MDIKTDMMDNIKACRTCGIHYVAPSKTQLKHLFQSCPEHSEINLILLELSQWNVEVAENDGFPQYICNTCIHKFEQVFQLRIACINAQNEFRKFYAIPNDIPNNKIKSEMPDIDETSAICDFIYVDDLSDGEYDGATPFNIPHIPIKEEIIEAATVPMEDSKQSLKLVESASRPVMPVEPSCSLATDYIQQNAIIGQPDSVEGSLCHQISPDQDEYKQQINSVHDTYDKECDICGKEFKNCTTARFKFHKKWHTLNKQVKCNACDFVCKSKNALNTHKRAKHYKVNCKVCRKVVLVKKIKFHMKQHMQQQQYACEYCTEAFSTENERENHIWQIHAEEDNSLTRTVLNLQNSYIHPYNDDSFNAPQNETALQKSEEDILFKFICAHCEHRFMEQIDLELHVQEEHRKLDLPTFEPKTSTFVETTQIEKTESTHNLINHHEHTVFDKYDSDSDNGNGNEIQLTNSNDLSTNTAILTQDFLTPTPLSFTNLNENFPKDTTELPSSSSLDESCITALSENVTNNFSTYVDDSNLNTFACANCTETFQSIEQLREHHATHLAAKHQSPTSAKFECNFCGKFFDLKFRLNRHIIKHESNSQVKT